MVGNNLCSDILLCVTGFIEGFCSLKNCKHGARCDAKGKCACPKVDDCPPDPRSVCGTDGYTYKNQCHLDVTSCQKQILVEGTKLGTCGKILGLVHHCLCSLVNFNYFVINSNTSNFLDTCSGKKCSNYSKCVAIQGKDSKCKCPKLADCSRKIELVCDKSDEETYINHCAHKVHSCRKQKQPGVVEEDYCCMFHFVFFSRSVTSPTIEACSAIFSLFIDCKNSQFLEKRMG